MWPFNKVVSFAVEQMDGEPLFFEANRVKILRNGRLVFKTGWFTVEAAVKEGEWVWVGRGLDRDALGMTEQ